MKRWISIVALVITMAACTEPAPPSGAVARDLIRHAVAASSLGYLDESVDGLPMERLCPGLEEVAGALTDVERATAQHFRGQSAAMVTLAVYAFDGERAAQAWADGLADCWADEVVELDSSPPVRTRRLSGRFDSFVQQAAEYVVQIRPLPSLAEDEVVELVAATGSELARAAAGEMTVASPLTDGDDRTLLIEGLEADPFLLGPLPWEPNFGGPVIGPPFETSPLLSYEVWVPGDAGDCREVDREFTAALQHGSTLTTNGEHPRTSGLGLLGQAGFWIETFADPSTAEDHARDRREQWNGCNADSEDAVTAMLPTDDLLGDGSGSVGAVASSQQWQAFDLVRGRSWGRIVVWPARDASGAGRVAISEAVVAFERLLDRAG